jgi:hypothetical protein
MVPVLEERSKSDNLYISTLGSVARVKKIQHFVELDDIDSFRLLGVTKKDVQNLKFS